MRKAFLLFSFFLCGLSSSAENEGKNTGGNAPWRTIEHVQNVIGTTNYVWNGTNLCFSHGSSSLVFSPGRKRCEVNGVTVWLNAPPQGQVDDGTWRLSGIDLDLLRLGVFAPATGQGKPLRVLVDAGHGGTDGGAVSENGEVCEKTVTLSVALRLGEFLATNGFSVCYTRTNDVEVSLRERSHMADSVHADLLVSVHANKADNRQATGVETYILPASGCAGTAEGSSVHGWQPGNRNDYANMLLGYSIQKRFSSVRKDADRGVKRQAFYVLRATRCPAVLVEIGFLSHAVESVRMSNPVWQSRQAKAIADGVCTFASRLEALKTVVSEKKACDAAANERWRRRLADAKKCPVEKKQQSSTPPVQQRSSVSEVKIPVDELPEEEENQSTPVAIEIPGIPPPSFEEEGEEERGKEISGESGDSMRDLLRVYGIEREK